MKICPKCQNQMDDNAVFCTSCGAQYTETAQQSTPVQEPQQTATNANDNVNTNSANNTNNGAPVPPPPPQPYVQPYAPAYDPNDHTAEFDPKDISDNKIYAMLGYLLGTGGIIIALLGAKDSPYAKFHVKQAIKLTVVTMLLSLITLLLFWTFIVPIVGGILITVMAVIQIICFFQVCSGKAKDAPIIRSRNFLK